MEGIGVFLLFRSKEQRIICSSTVKIWERVIQVKVTGTAVSHLWGTLSLWAQKQVGCSVLMCDHQWYESVNR